MKKSEIDNFCRKNQLAMLMLHQADQDYMASRCCILSGLFSGFILACQAIEKTLKAFICLSGGVSGSSHSPLTLKNTLKGLHDFDLDKHDDLLNRLYAHYQRRYPDNSDGSTSMSTTELVEIDELWIELKEKLPMPPEVKYRTLFYTTLYHEHRASSWIE